MSSKAMGKPLRHRVEEGIRDGLANAGIDVRRNPYVNPLKLQMRLLNTLSPVVFDVGAHIGLTVQAYRHALPTAIIHAFEPFPSSLAALRESVRGDPNTHVHALALSDTNAPQTFFVNEAEATNSLKPVSDEAAEHWGAGRVKPTEEISIACETLDAVCAAENIESIDILKIDVQGAEYEVLQGARGMLGKHAIKLIQFECILAQTYAGQRPMHEYLALMDSLGYQFLDFFQPLRRNGRLLQVDLMFASPEIRVA